MAFLQNVMSGVDDASSFSALEKFYVFRSERSLCLSGFMFPCLMFSPVWQAVISVGGQAKK